MKYLLHILIVSIILLAFASQNRVDKKNFFVIDYEAALNNKQTIKLSQIASNVEYIQLETNNECLLKAKARYFFVDSLIFVDNYDHVLKFNNKGKFLKKFGTPGRGPGEIGKAIADLSIISSKKQVAVQSIDYRILVYFSFDGKYIKTETHPYRGIVKKMNDGQTLIRDSGPINWTKYTFLLSNEKRDTLSFVPNYSTVINTFPIVVAPSYSYFPERFYYFNKEFYFKDDYNDTVYYIDAAKIKPAYFVNLGKYKLPEKLRPESLEPSKMYLFNEKAQNYYSFYLFETANKIFVSSHDYRRGSPKYVLYDKPSHTGNFVNNSEGISTGLINDWDGGSDFWPFGSLNNNKVYMPIDIADLQKDIKNKRDLKGAVKFPEKQKQLSEMINGLDILNNPIIMVLTLR